MSRLMCQLVTTVALAWCVGCAIVIFLYFTSAGCAWGCQ